MLCVASCSTSVAARTAVAGAPVRGAHGLSLFRASVRPSAATTRVAHTAKDAATVRPEADLLQRAITTGICSNNSDGLGSLTLALVGVTALSLFFPELASAATDAGADIASSHGAHNAVATLSQDVDFWTNMARYARFTVSVAVGMVVTIFRPFVNLATKNPIGFVVAITGLVASTYAVKFTLTAMIGMDDSMVFEPASPLIGKY